MLQHLPAVKVRAAFDALAEAFVEAVVVATLDPADLARPALGVWDVRALIGHTLRAFTTAVTYLDAEPTVPGGVSSTTEYYRTVLAGPSIHAAVAQRGIQAGIDLGDDVAATVRSTVESSLAVLHACPDDAVVNTPAGAMQLPIYLGTRVVEAGIHLTDLQRATDQPVAVPAPAGEVLMLALIELPDPLALALALTGRSSLPDGYNVLSDPG